MRLSPLVAVCEEVWKSIQDLNPDVPNVVIVIGSGGRRAPSLLGHFAKNSWGNDDSEIHEVLLVAENLNRSAEDVFRTLLHEAVHGIAHVRGIKDVSGQRHNKKFAQLCVEVGLEPPEYPDSRLGYSGATLTEGAIKHFAEEIEMIEEELKLCRKIAPKTSQTKKTTWIAECLCGRKVRLPRKTIENPDELDLLCHVCDEEFKLSDEEKDSFKETVGV